jgi:uncharacterized repeat protein (TIGR02543 family)
MKMKRFSGNAGILRRVPAALAFAAVLLALTACPTSDDSDETPSLTEIKVETTKDIYLVDEDLDLATITVTGVYSDGSEKTITITRDNISGYVNSQSGTCTVTITVEGKTAAFQVTVKTELQSAQEELDAAIDEALDAIEKIEVSAAGDGSDIPEGVKWVTPEQKQALQDAIDAAQQAASGASKEEIAAALEALQEAAEEFTTVSENQKGTATTGSCIVTFDNNGGEGVNPETKTVISPATTIDSLPAAPTRSNYTFRGWNTKADGTGSPFTEATLVLDNITVYAQWMVDYDISLDQTGPFTFPVAAEGYEAPQAKSVTITNTGAKATGNLTVALTGTGMASFILSKTSISSIAAGGNADFTVVPETGLAEGAYTATVTVSGGNDITAAFGVSFMVAPALTGTVNISGPNLKVWSTLTADTGALGGSGGITYKWQRSDTSTGAFANISGATRSTYRLELADQGKYIRVEAARAENAGTITSNTLGPVEAPPSGNTDITIGFAYGDITVNGSDGTNLIYKTTNTPTSITLTVTDYTDVQWYIDGAPVASPEGNADSITLNAVDYAAREHSVTFTGKQGSVLFSKLIPFTVQN